MSSSYAHPTLAINAEETSTTGNHCENFTSCTRAYLRMAKVSVESRL